MENNAQNINARHIKVVLIILAVLLIIIVLIAFAFPKQYKHDFNDLEKLKMKKRDDYTTLKHYKRELGEANKTIDKLKDQVVDKDMIFSTYTILNGFFMTFLNEFDLQNIINKDSPNSEISDIYEYTKRNKEEFTNRLIKAIEKMRQSYQSDNYKHIIIILDPFIEIVNGCKKNKNYHDSVAFLKEKIGSVKPKDEEILNQIKSTNLFMKKYYMLIHKFDFYFIYGRILQKTYDTDEKKELFLNVFCSTYKLAKIITAHLKSMLSFVSAYLETNFIEDDKTPFKQLYDELTVFEKKINKVTYKTNEDILKLINTDDFIQIYNYLALYIQYSVIFLNQKNLKTKQIKAPEEDSIETDDIQNIKILDVFETSAYISSIIAEYIKKIIMTEAIDEDLVSEFYNKFEQIYVSFKPLENDFKITKKIIDDLISENVK
ncbi:hypothetical protein GVAV_002916 [Gurleya vavrai]